MLDAREARGCKVAGGKVAGCKPAARVAGYTVARSQCSRLQGSKVVLGVSVQNPYGPVQPHSDVTHINVNDALSEVYSSIK